MGIEDDTDVSWPKRSDRVMVATEQPLRRMINNGPIQEDPGRGVSGQLEPFILGAAVKLAQDNGAHLTVLDIVSPLPRSRKTMQVDGRDVDIEALLRRDREERLRRLVQKTRGGPNTEVILTIGEPSIEVVRHVLTHGNDLVMVGGYGADEGKVPQLDSGVMQLLRKCPVPVWVMRPSRARKLRILALVDPDPTDPVRDGLNNLVLQLATSLASRQGGKLHVGHAWSLPYDPLCVCLRSCACLGARSMPWSGRWRRHIAQRSTL